MTIFAGAALSPEIVRSRSTSESAPGEVTNVAATNVGVSAAALAAATSARSATTIANRTFLMMHPLTCVARLPDPTRMGEQLLHASAQGVCVNGAHTRYV